jgi:hypothetical protein
VSAISLQRWPKACCTICADGSIARVIRSNENTQESHAPSTRSRAADNVAADAMMGNEQVIGIVASLDDSHTIEVWIPIRSLSERRSDHPVAQAQRISKPNFVPPDPSFFLQILHCGSQTGVAGLLSV